MPTPVIRKCKLTNAVRFHASKRVLGILMISDEFHYALASASCSLTSSKAESTCLTSSVGEASTGSYQSVWKGKCEFTTYKVVGFRRDTILESSNGSSDSSGLSLGAS